MADKLTQQVTDALTKAAAHPTGLPLYAGKSEPGLFPNSSAAKPAAQKCLADEFIKVAGTDTKGKSPRDLFTLTDRGWEFLLAQVNPKQVLEDFVRVLEARQGEVGELLTTARHMAESLQGLKDAVARVLPVVREGRVAVPASLGCEPGGTNSFTPEFTTRGHPNTDVAFLEAPPRTELAPALLARLKDWSGAAGEDCPLPELYRALSICDSPPTIGEFHDCLRRLQTEGTIYLHPWTGPLYALPEPAYALLAGHNVAYYVSLKQG